MFIAYTFFIIENKDFIWIKLKILEGMIIKHQPNKTSSLIIFIIENLKNNYFDVFYFSEKSREL